MSMSNSGLSNVAGGFGRSQKFLAVLNEIAILFPVFLLIFTWRGFFQALVARLMGDDTAQRDGFLTLNPLAHVDLMGMMIIIGVYFVIGGLFFTLIPRALLLMFLVMLGVRWTNQIPIDERLFKHYRLGGTLTSIAGSLGNFILAFFATGCLKLVLRDTLPPYAIVTFVEIFKTVIDISLFFGVLDLIPLPPFDGGRALRYLLPRSSQPIVDRLEEYSLYIFLILFFAPGISDLFFGGIFWTVMNIKQLMFVVFF